MTAMNHPARSNAPLVIGLALLALAGVAITLYASRLGAGLTDDSYFYIQPSRAVIAGEGLHTSPFFAPLLPVTLIVPALLGLDAQIAVRLLNALMSGVVVALTGLAVWRMSASRGFALLAAVLALTAENLLNVFPWAMTEPLYIALMLATFLTLARYLSGGRRGSFWAALILAALGALTRYMGIMLVGAAALALLLWRGQPAPRPFSRRVNDALLFNGLSALPVLLYVVNNLRTTGTFFGPRGGYTAGAYDPGFLSGALATLLNWFVPGRFISGREILLAAGLVALVIMTALWYATARRSAWASGRTEQPASPLALALGVFVALNVLFLFSLLFTRNIVGVGEAYSNRYLAPVYVAVLALICAGLVRLWRAGGRLERAAIALVALALVFTYAYRTQDAARALSAGGMGYASERWHVSETVRYLNLHPDMTVVSTGNYGLYFWTGRLPRSIGEFTSADELRAYLRATGGWLVVIDSMPPEVYNWRAEDLLAGMVEVQRFSEGAVYRPLE